MLAECLCERLGYRSVGREEIVERAVRSGISAQELADALDKPPSLLERFQHKKYLYLAVIQAALAEEVRTGRAVYHGNAGHLLLKGGGPVLRLRVVAPLEFRIEQSRQRLGLSRAAAIRHIHKVDKERQKWSRFLYDVDWQDPSLYDLVINLEHMDIELACDIVSTAVRKPGCFEFNAECRRSMEGFARASRVRADLALNPATGDLELAVTAADGTVSITGRIHRPEQLPEIERVSTAVEGVTAVDTSGIIWPTPD